MSDTLFAPPSLEPVLTTTDQVFRWLYSAVISLKLPPGTKVSEIEIARQMEVSRQPVRDAFFRLSKLGFLAIRPQRATLVTKISPRAVLNAVFVRSALEMECVAVCCQLRTNEDIAELRENLGRQELALSSSNPADFHVHDEAFHQMLCRIAGYPHTWEIIQEQKAHMDRVRFLTLSQTRRREVMGDHAQIVEAIAAQNASLARELLRDHVGSVSLALQNIQKEHAEYFDDRA